MASHIGKTDWRHVRLSGNNYTAQNLCQTCSRFACAVRDEHQICGSYIPTLAFNPPLRGFEGVFNTFRMGDAPVKNLYKSQVVGLLDTSAKEVFGYASVIGLISGDKDLLALEYAVENHNLKDRGFASGDAAGELLARLRRRYGKRIYERTETASVIRMMRLTSEF